MSRNFILCTLSVCCLAMRALAAPALVRPAADRGVDAKTLLVYSARHTAYSLSDNLELLKLQLQRVATRLETVTTSEATPDKLALMDYLVIFCPQPSPELPKDLLLAIANAKQPLLWIGFGAEQLSSLEGFKGQFEVAAQPADKPATTLDYRARHWNVAVYPWIPVTLGSNSAAQIVMTLSDEDQNQTVPQPVCWKTNQFTFFAAVPTSGAISFLFSDLLLDFYGVQQAPSSRVFVRIEDYHCFSNHREVQRMADYLYARSVPFILSVIPAARNPETGALEDLDSQPDFVTALRYAQNRGGRLIVAGYAHEPGKSEFWDTELDRPLADDRPEAVREAVQKAVRQFLRHGLFPLAWQAPQYAASRSTYTEISKTFSSAVERVQLSDSTHLENGVTVGLTIDRYGRSIVPENLGYVQEGNSNSYAGIQANAEMITRLRGFVAGAYLPAYASLSKLTGLVDTLQTYPATFLDLAELDHAVQLPDLLLLAGNARRTVTLRNATVRWKAFDGAGKLLAEEVEKNKTTGERTFRRIGVGEYELVEFIEGNP